jgi:hypothetical protein
VGVPFCFPVMRTATHFEKPILRLLFPHIPKGTLLGNIDLTESKERARVMQPLRGNHCIPGSLEFRELERLRT